MKLVEILDEIDAEGDVARHQANERVKNALRSAGWWTRDDGVGRWWSHEKFPDTTYIQDAVDIQCAWDLR